MRGLEEPPGALRYRQDQQSGGREQTDAPAYRETCWGTGHEMELCDRKRLSHLERLFFLMDAKADLLIRTRRGMGRFLLN